MIMRYWSADTLFAQLSNNYNIWMSNIKDAPMVIKCYSLMFKGGGLWRIDERTDIWTYAHTCIQACRKEGRRDSGMEG